MLILGIVASALLMRMPVSYPLRDPGATSDPPLAVWRARIATFRSNLHEACVISSGSVDWQPEERGLRMWLDSAWLQVALGLMIVVAGVLWWLRRLRA